MKKGRCAIIFPVLFFLLLFLVEASCSKGKLIPSEDGVRVRKMNDVIEKIRTSYLQKDSTGFLRHVSQEDPAEALVLEQSLDQIFEGLDPLDLAFFLEKVILQDTRAKAFIHWQGKWKRKDQGKVFSKKGDMVFLFKGKKDPLLTGIEGESPLGLNKLGIP